MGLVNTCTSPAAERQSLDRALFFVQVRWRRGGLQSGSACPFCKGLFAVTYTGPLSDKKRAVLAAERAALAAAQQRAREVAPAPALL